MLGSLVLLFAPVNHSGIFRQVLDTLSHGDNVVGSGQVYHAR